MMTGEADSQGALFVISGPSGAGKSTIVSRLKQLPGVFYSVSVTSRSKRPGEKEAVDYHFVAREDFQKLVDSSGFAEYAEVAGNMYGTPRAPLEDALARGLKAIVDIDVQGAMQIKEKFPFARLIFIEPPGMDVLEQRLRKRGTESEEVVRRRLDIARGEMESAPRYDYRVVNDDLESAIEKTKNIILS